jgi:anti-sigma factor RsiW
MNRPIPRDVACVELVEMLTDYLEGALPPGEVSAVEFHLADCDGCASYLDQMRATIRSLGSVPVDSLSDEAMNVLLTAFARRGET